MRSSFLKQNFWIGTVLGLLVTAIILVIKMAILHSTAYQGPYGLLLLSVIVSVVYGGYWAGTVNLVAGAGAASYFFLQPLHTLTIPSTTDRISLVIYLFQAVIVMVVITILISQEKRLEAAHHEEEGAKQLAERRLRDIEASESRFRSLIDSNLLGVMFWQWDGAVVDANPAFLAMLGFSENELINGKINWLQILAPKDQASTKAHFDTLKTQGTLAPLEKEFIRKDGKHIKLLLTGSVLQSHADGGVAFVLEVDDSLKKK